MSWIFRYLHFAYLNMYQVRNVLNFCISMVTVNEYNSIYLNLKNETQWYIDANIDYCTAFPQLWVDFVMHHLIVAWHLDRIKNFWHWKSFSLRTWDKIFIIFVWLTYPSSNTFIMSVNECYLRSFRVLDHAFPSLSSLLHYYDLT